MSKVKTKQPKVVRTLLKSVREYKKPSLITPIFMAIEAFCECLIPFFMAQMIKTLKVRGGDSDEAFE